MALSYGRIAKIAAQLSNGLVNSAMGQIPCSTERISSILCYLFIGAYIVAWLQYLQHTLSLVCSSSRGGRPRSVAKKHASESAKRVVNATVAHRVATEISKFLPRSSIVLTLTETFIFSYTDL